MNRGTTKRTVRIDDTLWTEALRTARENGENLSDIIRECLKVYIQKWGTK